MAPELSSKNPRRVSRSFPFIVLLRDFLPVRETAVTLHQLTACLLEGPFGASIDWWAEQKTSRERCCGKTAIHHTCQAEFRRAKNCSFALRRLGQNREAKRVRPSLPVRRQCARYVPCANMERVRFFPQGGIQPTRAKGRRRIPILQALRGPVAYAPHETTGTSKLDRPLFRRW
jgi:hypothetical protein